MDKKIKVKIDAAELLNNIDYLKGILEALQQIGDTQEEILKKIDELKRQITKMLSTLIRLKAKFFSNVLIHSFS